MHAYSGNCGGSVCVAIFSSVLGISYEDYAVTIHQHTIDCQEQAKLREQSQHLTRLLVYPQRLQEHVHTS